jgi:hypothetical protein
VSDKQIAANRRNARKSTGPRSTAGKKRVARNAYRHGLSVPISSIPAFAKVVERLARKITADKGQEISFDRAYAVAEAELDVARVRRAKIATIECMRALGSLETPPPEPVNGSATTPVVESQRSAEALQRALLDLLKLDRYERHAVSRRDRAVRELIVHRIYYNL